jgi:GT2 family glycosyltransferase
MKIAVSIPVWVNNQVQYDFLNQCLETVKSKDHEIIVVLVENHTTPIFKDYKTPHPNELIVIKGRQPQSVAKGWNDGIKTAFDHKCDYCLVVGQDVILRSDSIDNLVKFANGHPEFDMVTMAQYDSLGILKNAELDNNWSEHPQFSAYMVRPNFFSKFGTFDENIKLAYFEDNDIHIRMALLNGVAVVFGGALFYHFGSRTINTEPELSNEVGIQFGKNHRYLFGGVNPETNENEIGKWGHGSLVNDVEDMRKVYFKHPYNEEDKPIIYWRPI